MSCYTCQFEASLPEAPPRDRILVEEHWRVAHSFNASLPGWLVLVPRRHVERLDELTELEAARIGPLLRELTAALRAVTGCVKTYVMLFAELEGFAHVHFHVVPRMGDFTEEERGANVFRFLGRPEDEQVPVEEMDRLAEAIGERLGPLR